MKKLIAVLLILIMTLSFIYAVPKPGTKIDDALYTDVRVFIDNRPIPAFTVGGNTVVKVNDLKNYGFDILWDEQNRTLTVKRNTEKTVSGIAMPDEKGRKSGSRLGDVKFTDIKTCIAGATFIKYVPSFNVNGDLVINIDELKLYGTIAWDSAVKTLKLQLNSFTDNAGLPVTAVNGDWFTVKNIGKADMLSVEGELILYNKASKKLELRAPTIIGIDAGSTEGSYSDYLKDFYPQYILLGVLVKSVKDYHDNIMINPNYDKIKDYISSQFTIDKFLYLDKKCAEGEKLQLANELKANGNVPLKVMKYYIEDNSIGIPEVTITFKNLTGKTVDAMELSFQCYDSFGRPVNRYLGKTNTVYAIAQELDIPSGGEDYITWTLNLYELTTNIKNIRVTNVHFTDGSAWKR